MRLAPLSLPIALLHFTPAKVILHILYSYSAYIAVLDRFISKLMKKKTVGL